MQHLFRRGRHSRKPMADRMRLEAGSDEFNALIAQGKRVVIYFEGERVDHVLVADEITGQVVQAEQPMRVNLATMSVATVTRRGVVGIEIEDAS
jgi:hypothetical protein